MQRTGLVVVFGHCLLTCSAQRATLRNVKHDLMATSEAAEVLECHIATVRRLAERGDLPVAMKAPGRNGSYFFHASDVHRVADERRAA